MKSRNSPSPSKKSTTHGSGSQLGAAQPSLAEKAHRALEELIVTLELPPGSVWNEQSLADRVGVGRTPTREAIKRLEVEHLIDIVPRHGVRILEIELYRQLQVTEARIPLELLISRWAAARASNPEREQLLTLAAPFESREQTLDRIAYLRHAFAASSFIASCSRNPFIAQALAPLHTLSRRFFYMYHSAEALDEFSDLHARRIRAVASGDSAQAQRATDELMKSFERFTRTVIERSFRSD